MAGRTVADAAVMMARARKVRDDVVCMMPHRKISPEVAAFHSSCGTLADDSVRNRDEAGAGEDAKHELWYRAR